MDDSFSLGDRGRRAPATAPKHAAPLGPRKAGSFERSRLLWGIVVAVIGVIALVGFMKMMSNAGNEIGEDNQRVVEQIGAAEDTQAELTANQSIQNATQLYATAGSFSAVTAEALGAEEPTFRYVTGPSSDPNTVSVAAGDGGVGLAVRSASGSCLYAFVQASGTTYGKGSVCTGDAATGATDPAWPSG
jgi:hypothetical protein